MVAPIALLNTRLMWSPPITFAEAVPKRSKRRTHSKRSIRELFTFTSRGWLSVVPRKLTPGVVPALPVNDHWLAPVADTVRTFPEEGVTEMPDPAFKETRSVRPLRLFTTWLEAIFAAVIELF